MRIKVYLTVCLFLFPLCASAQDGGGFRNLDYATNYDKFCFGPSFRNIPLRLRKPADGRQPLRLAFRPWRTGRVLLADRSELEGSINFNIARNQLQLSTKDTYRVFVADEILSFEVYDDPAMPKGDRAEVSSQKTVFLSLPHLDNDGVQRTSLFEVMVDGKTSLLRRQHNRELFLMNHEGQVTQIKRRKKQVIKSFDGRHQELNELVERETLNMREIDDVMTLVETYNRLSEQ